MSTWQYPDDYVSMGDPAVSIIRWLGFVGNTHYCPSCMNEFWANHGMHDRNCEWAVEKRADDAEV